MYRLERFEKTLATIMEEYVKLGEELKVLRDQGKMKTTKFRDLLGKKMVYMMIINIFKENGLIDK